MSGAIIRFSLEFMTIEQNIDHIKELMHQTESSSHRKPGDVILLAVSKNQSIDSIKKAFDHGITHFGENYLQEALIKMDSLQEVPVHWHFIGPIQSNKAKKIATTFSWVHSIDRIKIASLLNEHRKTMATPLNVCVQINLLGEVSKSGLSPKEADEVLKAISLLPHLNLRGLMLIPPPLTSIAEQYQVFLKMKQLFDELNARLKLNMDTLSMGMSDDFIPAIKAGSTLIRIGQAIFGLREGASA